MLKSPRHFVNILRLSYKTWTLMNNFCIYETHFKTLFNLQADFSTRHSIISKQRIHIKRKVESSTYDWTIARIYMTVWSLSTMEVKSFLRLHSTISQVFYLVKRRYRHSSIYDVNMGTRKENRESKNHLNWGYLVVIKGRKIG